jgi:hypothetical protein
MGKVGLVVVGMTFSPLHSPAHALQSLQSIIIKINSNERTKYLIGKFMGVARLGAAPSHY